MPIRWWRAAVILASGTSLGLAWNTWSGRGIGLATNAFVRPGEALEEIDATEAKKRLDRGALFFDARARDFYTLAHIPGARPLPENDFERAFADLEPLLRSRFDLVVYCTSLCDASHEVARKLRGKGIQVAILVDGLPAWEEAGFPVHRGDQP